MGGGGGGVSAPSVGVLMELVAAVRCPDGRLIVLAYGMGRLRVGCLILSNSNVSGPGAVVCRMMMMMMMMS